MPSPPSSRSSPSSPVKRSLPALPESVLAFRAAAQGVAEVGAGEVLDAGVAVAERIAASVRRRGEQPRIDACESGLVGSGVDAGAADQRVAAGRADQEVVAAAPSRRSAPAPPAMVLAISLPTPVKLPMPLKRRASTLAVRVKPFRNDHTVSLPKFASS